MHVLCTIIGCLVLTVIVVHSESDVQPGSCATVSGKVYNDTDQWLNDDCTKRLKCVFGRIIPFDTECPANSKCENGICQCSPNFKIKKKDNWDIVLSCSPMSYHCLVDGVIYMNWEVWINQMCTKFYKCRNGYTSSEDYTCPANSVCNNGRCECNNLYTVNTRNFYDILGSCKLAGRSCVQNGVRHDDGTGWLDADCKRKVTCSNGRVKTARYNCLAKTTCDNNGACQCNSDMRKYKTDGHGLIRVCKVKSLDCMVGDKKYESGETWLSDDCKTIYTCNRGEITQRNYNCPRQSTCTNGACKCNTNYQGTSKDANGRLSVCGVTRDCVLDGKVYPSNHQWLRNDCTARLICTNKRVSTRRASCPKYSACKSGKCECEENFKVKSLDRFGIITGCIPTSTNCLYEGQFHGNGEIWINQACAKKFICNRGIVASYNFRCPVRSKCNDEGKCQCITGFAPHSYNSYGILSTCRRRNSRSCTQDGVTVQDGEKWLRKTDCRLRYACSNGRILPRAYTCPQGTTCINGNCKCNANLKRFQTDILGFLKSCIATTENCYVGDKTYENGDSWLQADCSKLFICNKGITNPGINYRCPTQSTCQNGECKCNNKYKAVSFDVRGNVKLCSLTKDCKVEGTTYKHLGFWLSAKCDERHQCVNNVVRSATFKCPDHSSCKLGGQCVCEQGYETNRQDANGILLSCKVKQSWACKNGFRLIAGVCVSVHPASRRDIWRSHTWCKASGATLLTTKDAFQLWKSIEIVRAFKGKKYFIMGDRSLASNSSTFNDIVKQDSKNFVTGIMQRYHVPQDKQMNALKRFSGSHEVEDWNFDSPLSSYCLGLDENGPTLFKCTLKIGFICKQGATGENDADVYWSSWYDVDQQTRTGSAESLHNILKQFNDKYTGRNDRLCTRPIEMECREKGTNLMFSTLQHNGYILNTACTANKIVCFNGRNSGKTCPDFEVRFKCIKDAFDDCDMYMARYSCEKTGLVCVNRRTGSVCIRQPRVRNPSTQLGTGSCTLGSRRHSSRRCKAAGDPHYVTLDGRSFDFQGTCSYDFVSTCKNFIPTESIPAFSVIVKNYRRIRGSTKAWTKGFALTVRDFTYIFSQGGFKVNGIEINAVGFSDENLSIKGRPKGRLTMLIIQTNFCVKIYWDNRYGLQVFVPAAYKNYVCGLCGDYDGRRQNDLVVEGTNKLMSQTAMNKEFMVAGPFEQTGTRCPVTIPEQEPCSEANKRRLSKPEFCGIFNVNSNSPIVKAILDGSDETARQTNKESLEEEYNECVRDVCWEPQTDRCYDIEEVIEDMNRALFFLTEELDQQWRKYSNCENSAETRCSEGENMEFKSKARLNCQPTCAEPDKDVDCDDETEESGCVCKSGFVLDATLSCVAEAECGKTCLVESEDGNTFSLNNGDEYVEVPCTKIFVCTEGQLVDKQVEACSIHATCVGNGKICRCNEGYTGNGTECKTDMSCRPGYTSIGEKCYKFVEQPMDWHSAAISCGVDGSVLARYDDPANEELNTFLQMIPELVNIKRAIRRKVFCTFRTRCNLPRRWVGLTIERVSKNVNPKCGPDNYALSDDRKSIVVTGQCREWFFVKVIRESRLNQVESYVPWISGNTFIVDQDQRKDKVKFQIDPPQMLDLGAFKDPNGCFQATINNDKKLIVTPESKCETKKTSICEYDNVGKIPHNPNDFKRLTTTGSHSQAVEMCNRIGRPLASILNSGQNTLILQLVRQLRGHAWLGGQYSDTKQDFVWPDNKLISYRNFQGGQPDNYNNNQRSDEKCVAMLRNNGRWFTEKCTKEYYPICGPPFDMEPAAYTKYYNVNGFSSLNELKQLLARQGKPDYICAEPISIECSARKDDESPWITNYNREARGILGCTARRFSCRAGRGLDCNSFRVKFLCPQEENQCNILKGENINPCSGGKTCLPVRNHFVCRCTGGKTWSKQLNKCNTECGICYASGDPHYSTYNGVKYDFMGTCMYKFAGVCALDELANSPTFDVYTKNNRCGRVRGVSCIAYVEVHLRKVPYKISGKETIGNFVFKISNPRSDYEYNGKQMQAGQQIIPGAFQVVRSNNYFSLTSEALELRVLFSGTKVVVNLPERFIGKMCGLCGDCNTSTLRKKDLTFINLPSGGKRYNNGRIIPFANEWMVPFPGTVPKKCLKVEPFEECAADMVTKLSQSHMCGIFKDETSTISQCFDTVDPTPYYDDCMVDACHQDSNEALCQSIKTYAQSCLKKGIILEWRQPNFCPIDCKEKVYQADASCEPMCGRAISANAFCDEDPEEGCVCPSGYMKRGDDCVPPEECGCEVVNDNLQTILIPPGESKLMSRCEVLATCEEKDGAYEVTREMVTLDPNAVCVEDPEPTIDCARGYILQEDGRTCTRDPQGCADEYEDKGGVCVRLCDGTKVWRQAVHCCNNRDGTLVLADKDTTFTELGRIMKDNYLDYVFISGLVKATVAADLSVAFDPVLTSQQQGKIAYYNFDYNLPPSVSIQLYDELKVDDLRGNDTILCLVIARDESGSLSLLAVSKDFQANVVCQGRYTKPSEETWYGPCNSDTDMSDDGDQETRESLQKINGCLVCPYPTDVRCTKVADAPGTINGTCKITKTGTYYSCDQGANCIDHVVETKCASDIDECAEGFHDCPPKSTCENVIGTYICKCNSDAPLMINGYCHEKSVCTMEGPSHVDDFNYKLIGFPQVEGSLYYTCPLKLFETCQERFDSNSGMPLLSIREYTKRINGQVQSFVSGWIATPQSETLLHFMVSESILREGKIWLGPKIIYLSRRDLGFTCQRTDFSFVPPNVLIVRHVDNYFRFSVTFPFKFNLEVSSSYSNMICGACRLKPDNPNIPIEPTESQVIEMSQNYVNASQISSCSTEPEIVPTQSPESTTTDSMQSSGSTTIDSMQSSESTTVDSMQSFESTTAESDIQTTESPTTSNQDCDDSDVVAFCDALNDVCTYEKVNCLTQLCGKPNQFCNFLTTTNVGECRTDQKMDAFLEDLNCNSLCSGDDMSFDYIGGQPPKKCQDVDADESASGLLSFGCRCDNEYKLSGSECVPNEECGCTYKDGIYLPKFTSIVPQNCSKKIVCIGNNKYEETAMNCSINAECQMTKNGYKCMCDAGYYGDADQNDGCKPPETEDERKVCFSKTNVEGVKQATCKCKSGYVSNCTDCVDVNECNEGSHDCDLGKEKCVNIPGSYRCSCAIGFIVKDGQCKDIDECAQGVGRCGYHEGCVNVPGSYDCQCCAGFKYNFEAKECQYDPNLGISILVPQPRCCLTCDNPTLCAMSETNPETYCVRINKTIENYPSYKAMFLHYCVNNIYLPPNSFKRGMCAQVILPEDVTPGDLSGPGTGGNGGYGSRHTTHLHSCFDPNFCSKIPQPPSSLRTGVVCGPAYQVNRKTYVTYCEMVKAVCRLAGGPSIISRSPIAAFSGQCGQSSTVIAIPNATIITFPGFGLPIAPGSINIPAVTTVTGYEPLLTEWSPWGLCRVENSVLLCGRGKQGRNRKVIPYDDGRLVRAIKPELLYEERPCFFPCNPDDPDFTTQFCEEPGFCGEVEDEVCGSIGTGGESTFDNQCILNVQACKAGKKPNFIKKGGCNQIPKKMCNQEPETVTEKYVKNEKGQNCVGEDVILKKCSNLYCEGDTNNCCVATDYIKKSAIYNCMDNSGSIVEQLTRVYLSAKSCECTESTEDATQEVPILTTQPQD